MTSLPSLIYEFSPRTIPRFATCCINTKPKYESSISDLLPSMKSILFIFKTRTDYPPEKEDENLVAYTLTITVGESTHTAGWTNASKDIPDCMTKIVSEIKRLVSKEKII